MLTLRKYKSEDCPILAQLFYDTVHTINAADYTEEQLNVWATGTVDIEAWDALFCENETIVAEINGLIVGFGDIRGDGYLDRLYVHKDYQRQGVATAICNELEQVFEVDKIITHASITAKAFFKKRGYKAVKKQQVKRQGVFLTNFVMEKVQSKSPEMM